MPTNHLKRPAKKQTLSKADRDYNEMLRSLRTNNGTITNA